MWERKISREAQRNFRIVETLCTPSPSAHRLRVYPVRLYVGVHRWRGMNGCSRELKRQLIP